MEVGGFIFFLNLVGNENSKSLNMKKLIKPSILPVIYIALGTILFGNQDLMIVIFMTITAIIYNYVIDGNKNYLQNFLEINGLFFILFIGSLFLKDAGIEIIRNYLLLMILSFSTVYFLKKNYKTISA